jgi:probable rRNA maturation factor
MSIIINNESDHSFDEVFIDELDGLAGFVLLQEQAALTASLSLTFVDNEEIAKLNQEYRQKEGPTDVLSFPCDSAGESGVDSEELADDDPSSVYWAHFESAGGETAPLLLGDVVIAPQVAAVQAQDLEKDFFDEIRLLLVHGVLHLLGYDHEGDEKEAQVMESREREILSDWAQLSEGFDDERQCAGACCG